MNQYLIVLGYHLGSEFTDLNSHQVETITLLHHPKPLSRTTLHSLTLRQETISLLLNRTPQNHIGYTLRSPSPLILSHPRYIILEPTAREAFQNWSPVFARSTRSVPPIPSLKPQLHMRHFIQHHISNIPQHRPPSFQPPLGP